jgi:hypothetical protein
LSEGKNDCQPKNSGSLNGSPDLNRSLAKKENQSVFKAPMIADTTDMLIPSTPNHFTNGIKRIAVREDRHIHFPLYIVRSRRRRFSNTVARLKAFANDPVALRLNIPYDKPKNRSNDIRRKPMRPINKTARLYRLWISFLIRLNNSTEIAHRMQSPPVPEILLGYDPNDGSSLPDHNIRMPE